ncbi:MAG: hypothetical protein JWO67_2252 [Streptosporangiaceae bacterium]|nr:hypothetical protein [Streptosporangiaceae bacterium]
MSREWLAAVLEAVNTADVRRTLADPLRLFSPDAEQYYIPSLSPALPRCPHPTCTEHADIIHVEQPHHMVPLDSGPTPFFEPHITVTWKPCGHRFRVPVEATADAPAASRS